MTTVPRWVPTWSAPYDQYGLPAVQTWEKEVGSPELSFCRKSQDSPVHPALFEFSTGAIFACFFD
jgi:hypothetical protein